MPKKPTATSELATQMALAEQIMRDDASILAELTGRESSPEAQLEVAREVTARRRRTLGKLADN